MAFSEAIAKSAAITSENPAPAAVPLTAAMTGAEFLAILEIAKCKSPVIFKISFLAPSPAVLKTPKSPPAQKAFPSPIKIITRTLRSASISSEMEFSSSAILGDIAFNASGRSSLISAMPSSTE